MANNKYLFPKCYRFDARGYLHDLQQFEQKPGTDYEAGLSSEEKQMVALCDEERYMALKKDLEDEATRHGTLFFVLHGHFNAV